MFIPVPPSVLKSRPGASGMDCKLSQLPNFISFVRVGAGRWIFNDGYNVIVVTERVKDGVKEYKVDNLFYKRGTGMWMYTDNLHINLGDMQLYLPCGEAYFQMIKAAKFGDWGAFWKIYKAKDARECKAFGNKVQGFDKDEWAAISAEVMTEVARLKLACQDVFAFMRALVISCLGKSFDISKQSCRFTECSPTDTLYGIGMDVETAVEKLLTADIDAVFDDNFLGGGKNLLGKAYDSAFEIFLACKGHECLFAHDLTTEYNKEFSKDFFDSFLQVEDGSNKKAKVDKDSKTLKTDEETTDAEVAEGLAAYAMTAEDLRSPSAPIARCLSGRTGSE